jgi:SAM-dependent methyltransferase
MSAFSTAYAGCYDVLYREKDYESECAFLQEAFACHSSRRVESVLDLGCGTGGHAIPLARSGLTVVGVDRAPRMLEVARDKARAAGVEGRTLFQEGDLETFTAGKKFDAVVCLFAVLSYQTGNQALLDSLLNMKRHLNPGGLLICDFWYGPSVLMQPPSDRFKIIEEPGVRIIRLSHPVLNTSENLVTIEYRLFEIRGSEIKSEATETHAIRYFFTPEINFFFAQAGLVMRDFHPSFRPGQPVTPNDWTVMAVASPAEHLA